VDAAIKHPEHRKQDLIGIEQIERLWFKIVHTCKYYALNASANGKRQTAGAMGNRQFGFGIR
jgi:hypothetical protein